MGLALVSRGFVGRWVGDLSRNVPRYSDDGQLVAIACGDDVHGGAVYLWSRRTERTVMVCRVNQAVLSVRFTARGIDGRERIIAGAADGILRAFEQSGGAERFRMLWQNAGHHKRVTECAVSSCGRAIVTCSADGRAQVISAARGTAGTRVSQTLDHDVTQRFGITGARVQPGADAASFATCSEDRRVRIFDRDSAMLLAESVAVSEPLTALCYASGGKAVVAGGTDGTLYFFDVSMPESYESAQNESALTSAIVDPAGELVVTGDRDDVKFYDAQTGIFLARQTVDREVHSLAFCAVSGAVPTADSETGSDEEPSNGKPKHMVYVRTGVLVAACASEHSTRRSNPGPGKIMIFKFDFLSHEGGYHAKGDLTFESAIEVDLPGVHVAVEAHPSLAQFVVCTQSTGPSGSYTTLALIDATNGHRLWESVLDGALVQSVRFSPSGTTLAVATCEGSIRLIRVSDGALVPAGVRQRKSDKTPAGPWEFNFLPRAVRLGAGPHNWTGVRTVRIAWGSAHAVNGGTSLLAVAHNRPWLREVSRGDGRSQELVGWTRPDVNTVSMYAFGGEASAGGSTMQQLYTLVRHPEAIEACDISADGALLCTGCRDGFLRIFDAQRGHQLYQSLNHSGRVLTAQFFTYRDGDIGVITSSTRGTWRLFLYDDYVRSTVALCTNLALQPAVSKLSLQVLQLAFCQFGRYSMAMNTRHSGGVFDLLFSRIADGPSSMVYGLSPHSVPTMLRRERVCPAVVHIVKAWPFSTATDINLLGGRDVRRTVVDVILNMGKSSDAVRGSAVVPAHVTHECFVGVCTDCCSSPFKLRRDRHGRS